MQNQNDTSRIHQFIDFASPFVCAIVKAIMQSSGWQVIQNGSGIDTVFSIKAANKEAEFHLHNLLLEIATIDRDEMPLRFDEGLYDFDFFLKKTLQLTESKLRILFKLFSDDDVEKAIENIANEAKNYQRIRIIRIDQGSQEQVEE